MLECRKPLSPAHGTMEYLDVRVGGHALFHCDPGYTLQGFQMATCLLDGSWSTPTPQCGEETENFLCCVLTMQNTVTVTKIKYTVDICIAVVIGENKNPKWEYQRYLCFWDATACHVW